MPSTTLPPDLLLPALEPPVPEAPAAPAPAAPATAALFWPAEPAVWADLPELRLIAVPDAAPPYDCETHGAACPARRDTSEADPRGNGPPAAPAASAPAAGSASPAGSVSPAGSAPAAGSATRAGSSAAGVAAAWPGHFAQVVVEILAGARSTRQIIPCTTDRVRAQIGHLVPLLTSDQRPRIQRILMSRPAARVVEMTVVVSFGPRPRALAIRCEHIPARPAAPGLPPRPARWLCTELVAV
ncbi:MAG TPA: Rv3235 family protein [Streptosporangiaceae bacterium]|nr:Rv3235 family protein [Streptosporangiaceae bacterium]